MYPEGCFGSSIPGVAAETDNSGREMANNRPHGGSLWSSLPASCMYCSWSSSPSRPKERRRKSQDPGDQRDAVDQCSCHPTLLIPGLVSDLSDLSHMTITLAHDSISTSLPPRCHAITPSKLVAWDGSRSRSRTGEIREGVWTLLRNHIMVVRRPQHEAVYPYACLIYGWCGGGSGPAVPEPRSVSMPTGWESESSPAAVAVQLPNISFRRCGAWLDRAAAVAAD